MYKIVSLIFILALIGCGGSEQQSKAQAQTSVVNQSALKSRIDQLEATLAASTSLDVDQKKVSELIEKSIQYVDAFPKDAGSPAYLFRTGEVCTSTGDAEKALALWERMQKDYPDHEKTPIALFFQGFTCENNLKDTSRAKKYYNAFLEKHPNHEYADQVQMLLKNIDISPEDLIKRFQEQRQR